jgi:hypothetical protein
MEMVVNGVSTRKVALISEELCGTEFSKSTVSDLCKQLDPIVSAWNVRSLQDERYPFFIVDAMVLNPLDAWYNETIKYSILYIGELAMSDSLLLTKNGIAVKKIARELLTHEVGTRIPRVQDFAEKLHVGRGTVQGALQLLVDTNAIRLESRGHLGTYLLESDFPKLWAMAGMSTLGAMPLPYSRRNEGLATGLYTLFERHNIPFHLSYMRGGANRVQALLAGRYDFVVMSRRAAECAVREHDVALLYSFGPYTYVGAHVLLVRNPGDAVINPYMRVGLDSSSIDQKLLTLELFKDVPVEYVELPYMQIFEQLVAGVVDAAVWNGDEIEHRFGEQGPVYARPLEIDAVDATEACIVVRCEDYDIFANLTQRLELGYVVEVQQEVLAGKRVPRY